MVEEILVKEPVPKKQIEASASLVDYLTQMGMPMNVPM